MSNSVPGGSENCGNARCYYTKAFVAMLFMFLLIHCNSKGQGFLAVPSCNISGPLEAVASGADITINIEVAHSTSNPKLSYEFGSNTSNAFIRTKGAVVYNPVTNSATQQLTVSPGTTGSEFNLKLEVSTPSGLSSCSKSVSVTSPSAHSSGGSSSGSSGHGAPTPGH